MGMSGVVRNRSNKVADELLNLVGEDIGWMRECEVIKWWKVCECGLLRSDMSMLMTLSELFLLLDKQVNQINKIR